MFHADVRRPLSLELFGLLGALLGRGLVRATRSVPTCVLVAVTDDVEGGSALSEAFAKHPEVFDRLYVNMVRAGETSGTLEIVLQRLADIMEKQQELKSRIQTAMAYPILMTAIGTLVLFFLMTFVVPNITTIFEDMNQALPTPTRFLITASDLFKSYWWLLVVLAAAALVGAAVRLAGAPGA